MISYYWRQRCNTYLISSAMKSGPVQQYTHTRCAFHESFTMSGRCSWSNLPLGAARVRRCGRAELPSPEAAAGRIPPARRSRGAVTPFFISCGSGRAVRPRRHPRTCRLPRLPSSRPPWTSPARDWRQQAPPSPPAVCACAPPAGASRRDPCRWKRSPRHLGIPSEISLRFLGLAGGLPDLLELQAELHGWIEEAFDRGERHGQPFRNAAEGHANLETVLRDRQVPELVL